MNLELRTTTYGGQVNFLDSQQTRSVRGGITLDHTDVVADANGIKKLKGGSFVGKKANGKWAKYVAGTASTLTTGVEGNNNAILWTAKTTGVAGDNIKVEIRDPGANNQALKVLVEGDTVVVSVATDGAGAITSTAAQVIDAVNGSLIAAGIVSAANAGASTGEGVVEAVAATNLDGGADANVTPTLLLKEDVVFTTYTATGGISHSDQVAAAYDMARVITSRLPEAPDDVVKANMPGITFA